MNAKRRWRHQPAIEAGGGYRPFLVKESRSCTGDAPGATDRCHRYFPLQPTVVLGIFVVFDPVVVTHATEQPHPAVPRKFRNARGSPRSFKNTHPDVLIMRAALAAN
jgi:hypothetical protein